MPQDLPDGLQTFLKVVLGQPWPEGDVGQLRELSRAWQTYHDQLEDLIKGFRSVGNALDQAMEGDAADQWINYLQAELPSGLTDLLAITQNFADGALNTAADIDEARIMIGIQAAITMAAVRTCWRRSSGRCSFRPSSRSRGSSFRSSSIFSSS